MTETKKKKSIFKKWWFYVGIIVILGALGAIQDYLDDGKINSNTKTANTEVKDNETEEVNTNKEKESTKGITLDKYKERLTSALKEKGDDTELRILSDEEIEDNRNAITLADGLAIFLDTDENNKIIKATVAIDAILKETQPDDFIFAFELLIGTVDDSLTVGERTNIRKSLKLYTEDTYEGKQVTTDDYNNVSYTFIGEQSKIYTLAAEYK
ncbi:hypothetical protein P9858_20020 [Niallia circulans]|uniref:hypothetical protein n=1 Tax=Niallia circulans TaxID=1397 RepID=UPI002E1CE6DA|nr:hypothetical protein [Niallia circulans]